MRDLKKLENLLQCKLYGFTKKMRVVHKNKQLHENHVRMQVLKSRRKIIERSHACKCCYQAYVDMSRKSIFFMVSEMCKTLHFLNLCDYEDQ